MTKRSTFNSLLASVLLSCCIDSSVPPSFELIGALQSLRASLTRTIGSDIQRKGRVAELSYDCSGWVAPVQPFRSTCCDIVLQTHFCSADRAQNSPLAWRSIAGAPDSITSPLDMQMMWSNPMIVAIL